MCRISAALCYMDPSSSAGLGNAVADDHAERDSLRDPLHEMAAGALPPSAGRALAGCCISPRKVMPLEVNRNRLDPEHSRRPHMASSFATMLRARASPAPEQ